MLYAGIDVGGVKKGQALCLMNADRVVRRLEHGLSVSEVLDVLHEVSDGLRCVGIDAPRQPVSSEAEKSGRACERELVRETGFRVQWTPRECDLEKQYNRWMIQGFELFARISRELSHVRTLEVFPSASYGYFPPGADINLSLSLFARKARIDQLDASCCALVSWCYEHGFFRSYGSGDAEGEIILPDNQCRWEA